MLAWALAVSALTGLVIGLTPALAAWRRDLRVDGGRATASSAATRLRRIFVAAECATAVVLLAGGGLFLRSWWNVSRVDPGFQADRVLALNLATPAGLPVAQRAAFYDAVLDRVSGVPGIERAGISSELFVGTVQEQPIVAEGGARAGTQLMPLRRDEIAGDVFDTLGTRLLGGRAFTPPTDAARPGRDRQRGDGQPAVARPRRRRPALRARPARSRRAVVHRRRRRRRHAPPGPRDRAGATDVRASRAGAVEGDDPLRARRRPAGVAPIRWPWPARCAPPCAASTPRPWSTASAWSAIGSAPELDERRVQAALLLTCAVVTLALATLGLYALIQHSVVARTHEIGVRMALGAGPGDIGRMVAGEGLVLAACGLAVGLAGAWGLARAASALLFGVGAADPATLVAVSALATMVAGAASYLPARRAARISPIVALRRNVP